MPARSRLGLRVGDSRHCSVTIRVLREPHSSSSQINPVRKCRSSQGTAAFRSWLSMRLRTSKGVCSADGFGNEGLISSLFLKKIQRSLLEGTKLASRNSGHCQS